LFPHLSIRANLVYAPGAAAELAGPWGQKVLDVLRLGPLLEREPGNLSGGERQRVALGRAWLSKPRLLLLDEPLSGLDGELAREVLVLLFEAKRSLGVPMVFVTHRASELIALADDCLVLDEGRVVAQGPPLDVLSRPQATGPAPLIGVDNLLRLEVLRHDEASGVTLLDLGGGQELASPLCAANPGESLVVGVRAEDILLCRAAPSATSARNVLEGRIDATDAIGHEVLISMRVGSQRLRVRVTPGALRELDLRVGCAVFALLKTTACHHLEG
jgi:molybdate transport system ATP-binding protein